MKKNQLSELDGGVENKLQQWLLRLERVMVKYSILLYI